MHQAEAGFFDDLEIHGFATQGYIKTSENNFFGDSESGSFDFRELGINASTEPLPNMRLAGQLLSRKAGEISDGDVEVDFALADVTLRSDEKGSVGVMVGRIKNPLGLYNEARDVTFLRPGVTIPQVVYYEKLRDLFLSSDGAALDIDLFYEHVNANLYVAMGEPRVDENVEAAFLGSTFEGDLEPDGLSFLGRVLFERPDGKFKAGLSVSKLSMQFKRSAIDPLPSGDIDALYGIASMQWSGKSWALTTEYMREPIKWNGFHDTLFDDYRSTAEGYYLQFALRAADSVEIMTRYGEIFADRNDRSGKDFSRKTFGTVPAHSRYSKIMTAGVRWDITRDVMLRAEYQRHNGTFILSSRENPDPNDTEPDWDLFALELSYRF